MLGQFRDLIAAVHSPMKSSGELNTRLVEAQARHLVRSGVTGVFVAGTTGEGLSLSVDERMHLASAWCETGVAAELKVIIHVGHNCLPDAKLLAAHAQQMGAAATSTMAPNYFKPASVSPLVDYCAEVAASAPDIPFYFYHIPGLTGVNPSMTAFLQEVSPRVKNFAGLKYTSEDLAEFQECVRWKDGRYEMFFGRDEALLAGLALGAQGAVGSSYNFAAPLYLRVVEAFEAGDLEMARQLQALSVQMIKTLQGYGYMAAAKSVMAMIGVDCGPVRNPLEELSREQQHALREDLETIGFFEWSKPRVASSS